MGSPAGERGRGNQRFLGRTGDVRGCRRVIDRRSVIAVGVLVVGRWTAGRDESHVSVLPRNFLKSTAKGSTVSHTHPITGKFVGHLDDETLVVHGNRSRVFHPRGQAVVVQVFEQSLDCFGPKGCELLDHRICRQKYVGLRVPPSWAGWSCRNHVFLAFGGNSCSTVGSGNGRLSTSYPQKTNALWRCFPSVHAVSWDYVIPQVVHTAKSRF